MILAVAATEIEMTPLQGLLQEKNIRCLTLVSGVGPVETAVRLSEFLAEKSATIRVVVNLGVAGGYIPEAGKTGPQVLDLYLAETEAYGDLGICYPDRMEALPQELTGQTAFAMDRDLLQKALSICGDKGVSVKTGNFITVAGVSASLARGRMLSARLQGHCENMEGAAVARVCAGFALPVLELRCISNLVEDRDTQGWRLPEACHRAAWAAAEIIQYLME